MDISGYLALRPCSCMRTDISGSYPPLRYYDLQHTLEEIFHNLSGEEQKRGAFLLFSYLSKWMWNTHFSAREPIDMKALVKTFDDAFTSMCEEMPREDLHPPS